MTKAELSADWLNWFRLTVRLAIAAQITGDEERARHAKSIIDRYYAEAGDHGFTADDLATAEAMIRAA